MVSQRFGRYRAVRRLGSGAFATVWLGHDDDLDAPVAIKILGDNWADDADVDRRFVEEARALRRISDPRVVRVHDIGRTDDGRGYFVMDFADAGTLADLVGEPMDTDNALRYAIAAAGAVQAVHDHGLLHRDVKPSNLLRHRAPGSAGEYLMVADLGVAKALADASGLTLTVGTPAYMAPEQAQGAALDARADVYGLAAVCYALLTGHPPFPADRTPMQVALRAPESEPESVGRGDLDAVLRDGLAFDRDRRPASAAELAGRLTSCLSVPTPDREPTPTDTSTPTMEPVRRIGVATVIVWCLVVFGIAAVLGWWGWGLFSA